MASPACYIGVMGPRKRTERMLRELAAAEGMARLHSPAGLDIGANVLNGRRGGKLRERRGSIHGGPADGECVTAAEERVLAGAAS